jgi:hypothetical protein
MLSLQILDGGEVRSLALDGRAVLIGSAPQCALRLQADGVAPQHARIEPLRGGNNYKLIDLGSADGTRVNGDQVAQVVLAVGDRIEIGAASLVVGKRVLRRATAEDVLDQGVPMRSRRSRAAAPARSNARWLIGGGVVLALGVGWLLADGGPPAVLRSVPELLARGDYEGAERILASLEGWVGASAARQQILQPHVDDLAHLKAKIRSLEQRVADTVRDQSVGDHIDWLRGLIDRGSVTERAAARRVLARLDDLRRSAALAAPRGERLDGPPERPAAPVEPPVADAKPVTKPAQPAPAPNKAASKPADDELERGRAALAEGDLRTAARLAAAAQQVSGASAERLAAARALAAEVEAQAGRVQGEVLTQADEMVALGQAGRAGRLLEFMAERLPQSFAARLTEVATTLAAAAVPEEVKKPTAVSANPLGELLRAVEAAETAWAAGHFQRAREQFAAAADQAKERDAVFAAELRGRSEDAAALAGMHVAVARRLRDAAKPEIAISSTEKARLIDCDDSKLKFVNDRGELALAWGELRPEVLDAILRAVDAPADAWLGAALLAAEAGEGALAENRAVQGLHRDAKVKDQVDRVVARLRGEPVPPGGYKFAAGKLAVATAESAIEREFDQKLAAALRQANNKARDAALADIFNRSPEQSEAVVRVLRRHQRALGSQIENHPFKKNWEKVAAERAALDSARKHALELIFDEEHYFYPYRPPAVSSEKAAEYAVVQRDVDERVEAVRALWRGAKQQFRVPSGLHDDVARFRWLTAVLERLGERSLGLGARARWVEALPEDPLLTLQTYCVDAEEVAKARLAARIHKLNAKRLASLSPGEREQLQVTNDYRALMGRHPLVIDLRLLVAARGHGEEMERLGYFGHMSPVPERRTPYDRMRLAGYAHGGSENLATNDSAEGAHQAWLHSSGHHRNILGGGHTEFACGQRGRYWTQNFGGGRDFERELPE